MLRSRLSVNTTDAAVDAAIAGMGLARANSYQVVDHVRRGALALTLEAHLSRQPGRVSLIYNSLARLPLKLRAFIDFVTPRLRPAEGCRTMISDGENTAIRGGLQRRSWAEGRP